MDTPRRRMDPRRNVYERCATLSCSPRPLGPIDAAA